MKQQKSKIRTTSRLADGVIIAIMVIAGLLCLLPILNVLALSFSSSTAAAAGRVKFWPVEFSLYSYKYALTKPQFIASFLI